MRKYYKHKDTTSIYIMYIIAIIMFFLLIFTILSFMHDEDSSLYVNFDKEIYNANVEHTEKAEIKEEKIKKNIAKKVQEADLFDIAIDKMGEKTNYDKYKEDYDKYYAEQKKKRQQELAKKQKMIDRAKEIERREKLERLQREKLAMMQNTAKKPPVQQTPPPLQQEPKNAENKIVSKAMQNSPCSPQSATAIAYFFHPNNTEPIELIFNNPNPSFNNGGNVKLVYGDLPRDKKHILKKNMVNLNQILNNPQYTTSKQNEAKRPDAALKVQSGVTTTCSPYVYQSKDFYLSNIPPSLEDKFTKESYCRNHNARLADPIELIPILLTGRFPSGLYWTSSHVLKMDQSRTEVSRSNLTPTQAYMLIDYDRNALGFVSENEYNANLQAYSVCVFDE